MADARNVTRKLTKTATELEMCVTKGQAVNSAAPPLPLDMWGYFECYIGTLGVFNHIF
jgi:hypothetical protein